MAPLMAFLEAFAVDKKYLWTVSTLYRRETINIGYFGTRQDKMWAGKKSSSAEWVFFDQNEILLYLAAEKIDLIEMETKLRSTIKTAAVHALMLIDDAEKILGKEVLNEAKQAYKNFSDQLIETIYGLLDEKSAKGTQQQDVKVQNTKKMQSGKTIEASSLRLVDPDCR